MSEEEESEKTEHEQKMEDAKEEIQALEEDPPDKLEDWPDGQAKYETFGGAEGDHSYDEGPEAKLGPDPVRHRRDGAGGGRRPGGVQGRADPGRPDRPKRREQPRRAAARRGRGRRARRRHLR